MPGNLRMNPSNYTCKLPIVGSVALCILNTEWADRYIKFLLLHDNHAWSGKFQLDENEDVEELLDQLSLTEEKYIEETKHALTSHDGANNFTYAIENNKFTWKKYLSSNMTIKFGYVIISKVPVFEVFEKIIDSTLQTNIENNKRLLSYEKQKGSLEEENQQLKTKLNDFITKKNEMEETLYSQFVYILNEKKKRIKELKKKLEPPNEDEQGSDELQTDTDSFGSDTEIDTEEEGKQSPSKMEVVNEIDSLDVEVEKKCILPKRRGRPMKADSIAGPSGCNGKQQKAKKLPVLSRTTRNSKKLEVSCVLGKVSEDKEKNNSEEDVFMFSKRSKRTTNCQQNVKPSSSKIIYDSDDETCLDQTVKTEPNSDNTPSDVENQYSNRTIKIEKMDEEEVRTDCVKEENREKLTKSKSVINGGNKSSNGRLNGAGNCKNKEYSNSTLDMLNRLI